MKSGIYQILNIVNQKAYIGSAKNLNRRKKTHFTQLSKGLHCNIHLQNAYNFYGPDSFKYEVLELTDNLIEREQYWIDSFSFENLYNICPKAGSRLGSKNIKPISAERKLKMRLANLGKKHSEETKKKLSIVATNISDETRNKIKEARSRQIMKPCSEETKRKISEAQIGKKISEETKKRLSIASTGKIVTEKTRIKMSNSRKGKKISEKTKEKISEANSKEFKLLSPLGVVIEAKNIVLFSKNHGLERHSLGKLINGEISEYKGWKIYK